MVLFTALGLAQAGPIDAVELQVGDRSVAPPFGNVVPRGTVRPALRAIVETPGLTGPHLTLRPAGYVGGHVHPNAGSGWRIGAELIGRATAGPGPFAELRLGLGAVHALRGVALAFDDGVYREGVDPGRLGAELGFGLGAGVDLSRRTALPLALTVTYRWMGQTAWLPVIPVGPMSELGLGARWIVGGAR